MLMHGADAAAIVLVATTATAKAAIMSAGAECRRALNPTNRNASPFSGKKASELS